MKFRAIITTAIIIILQINLQSQTKETSGTWTSFSQSYDVSFVKEETKFKLTGFAKVITNDSTASSGLWARVDTKNGERGFFDNMGDRPIRSNEWQEYEVNGVVDENSKLLTFGGICQLNGEFLFDSFNLYIQREAGAYEKVDLKNSDFETVPTNERLFAWSEGISKNRPMSVKEFNIDSSTDHVSGNHSLLITGKGVSLSRAPFYVGPVEGYDLQIGVLTSMLNELSTRVELVVQSMDQRKTDWLLDDKANSIGTLVMHLAAAEVAYQVATFEERGFNDEEKKKWQIALDLGPKAQKLYKNKPIEDYLKIYKDVRQKTLEELAKRDDKWLMETNKAYGVSNYWSWFHVMEHQSSHLGQILFLQKRIPKEVATIDLEKK